MKSSFYFLVGLGALLAWLASVCLGIAWGVILPTVGLLYLLGYMA